MVVVVIRTSCKKKKETLGAVLHILERTSATCGLIHHYKHFDNNDQTYIVYNMNTYVVSIKKNHHHHQNLKLAIERVRIQIRKPK